MADQSAPQDSTAKAWSGRFSEPVSDLVKRYTASVFFDKRMAAQDIRGSLAHAKMLARQGIIGAQDLADIERGMAQIAGEIERGEFNWNLDDEDVHLNIEKRLTALVGDAGKRLHTGRSRNDQVATDIRLWLRDAIDTILGLIREFQLAVLDLAEHHAATPLPGFTHLQVGGAEDALRGEHAGMGEGALDVGAPQAPVEEDAGGVALHQLVHRLGEQRRPAAGFLFELAHGSGWRRLSATAGRPWKGWDHQ